MSPESRPEAIDSRLVLRVYACIALPAGILAYMWPLLFSISPDAATGFAYWRVKAAAVAAAGCGAASFAAIDDPMSRRRALLGFANAHVCFGVLLGLQWIALLAPAVPPIVGWAPWIVGLVLLYVAITGPGADFTPALPPIQAGAMRGPVFAVRNKRAIGHLRSQYEEQIRQAARQEERTRLARDLHDAVKQQLFAIQTSAATAQARFDSDRAGAREAVDQVRGAAREAMTEMEAMLDQLQAAPIENAGLVEFLRKQCEALGFRSGAAVTFEPGLMPDNHALDPGARQAISRVAQEALSNVARHARARNVHVSLGLVEGRFVLIVKDDGSGLPVEEQRHGMGMANIAARAAEVGGTFEVVGAPGAGTTVRFSVPCHEPPSPRPYLHRAAVWMAILLVLLTWIGYAVVPPLAFALVVIAAIAVARYTVAAYWLTRRQQSA